VRSDIRNGVAGVSVDIDSSVVIETARLRLTPVREADAAEMAVVLSDPRLHEFIGGVPPSMPELRGQYRRWEVGSGNPDELWLNWVVRMRESGAPVGSTQATVTPGGPDGGLAAVVAWVTGVPWQGSGYASEAAAGMVSWLAGTGATVITANIHPWHRASEKVAQRAGFALTDRTVEGERVWSYDSAAGG
jgi:RimJ/RimL family protein N-acetyltransferase